MSLSYRETDGGVILAEHSMDVASIERALKQRDPDLRLQGWPTPEAEGGILWKVVRLVSVGPPETICVWASERGEIYPLSSGLLDKVDRLDKNSRSVYLNEDQLNAQKREREKVSKQKDIADIADYNERKHGEPILPRSQSLVMARRREWARGKNV